MTEQVNGTEQKLSAGEMLKRVARTQRSTSKRVDEMGVEMEQLRDELIALRRHNAMLAAAAFSLITWKNEEIAALAQQVDDENARGIYQTWIERFSQLQGSIAPATFREFYGIDPVTGEEVGSGALTDGDVSHAALDVRLEDVPVYFDDVSASEAGRRHSENGALDNK